MKILVAWANNTAANLGVRVLAQGSRDLLSQVWPGAEFEYMNYGARPDAVTWTPKGLFRERVTGRRGMMDWFSQFDLMWDTRSGDSFTDIYGMDRHRTMSLIHEFVHEAEVPVGMAPQTIGPFSRREARLLARRNLSRSSLVFARDAASARAAAALGRPVEMTVTDMVFGLEQPEKSDPHDVVLNVSGLLWHENSHVDHEAYRHGVHSIIQQLISDGRSITLLPHVLDSPNVDNDVPVAKHLVGHYDGALDLVVPQDLDDARGLIASAQVVIGARMHACLNALSTGVPAVAMAYSRKFAPLMNALGWEHVVPIADGDETARAVLASVRRDGLGEHAREVQARARDLMDRTIPLLGGLTS